MAKFINFTVCTFYHNFFKKERKRSKCKVLCHCTGFRPVSLALAPKEGSFSRTKLPHFAKAVLLQQSSCEPDCDVIF